MTVIQASDHPDIFVEHSLPEHSVDLGEIRMNYATAGRPGVAGAAADSRPNRVLVGLMRQR